MAREAVCNCHAAPFTGPKGHSETCPVYVMFASPDREPVRAREAELVRALEWYAERRNYVPAGPPAASPPKHLMERDAWDGNGPGARARAALASARGETGQYSEEDWIPCANCGAKEQELHLRGGRVLCTDCDAAASSAAGDEGRT